MFVLLLGLLRFLSKRPKTATSYGTERYRALPVQKLMGYLKAGGGLQSVFIERQFGSVCTKVSWVCSERRRLRAVWFLLPALPTQCKTERLLGSHPSGVDDPTFPATKLCVLIRPPPVRLTRRNLCHLPGAESPLRSNIDWILIAACLTRRFWKFLPGS